MADKSASHNMHSVMTVNLGGPQLSPFIWECKSEFVSARCPRVQQNPDMCKCHQTPGVYEIPFVLQKKSDRFFGRLQINVVAEVPVQGDDISLQHGLEVTIQKLNTCALIVISVKDNLLPLGIC